MFTWFPPPRALLAVGRSAALGMLLVAACGFSGGTSDLHSSTPLPLESGADIYNRPDAILWSRRTGKLLVSSVGGDTLDPFNATPKHLYITFAHVTDERILRRLVATRAVLPLVTIDDRGDGEYYHLRNLEATAYRTIDGRPVVTFAVGSFRLTCGPPTCRVPYVDKTDRIPSGPFHGPGSERR